VLLAACGLRRGRFCLAGFCWLWCLHSEGCGVRFHAARSLPDGSWNSKHEAGKPGSCAGAERRAGEREGAAWDPCDLLLPGACGVSRCRSEVIQSAERGATFSPGQPKKPTTCHPPPPPSRSSPATRPHFCLSWWLVMSGSDCEGLRAVRFVEFVLPFEFAASAMYCAGTILSF
jgi:hypothetical protein